MKLIQFEPAHLKEFLNFGGQEKLVLSIKDRDIEQVIERGPCFTGTIDGRIVGCGGFAEANPYRATAWGVFQKGNPADFLAVHMVVRRALAEAPYRCIDAFVNPKSPPAMRWIRRLGFQLERSYKPYWFPDGSGASEWALYK